MSLDSSQVVMLLAGVLLAAGCSESSAPGGLRVENGPAETSPDNDKRPPETLSPKDPPRDVILDKTFDDIKFEMEKGGPFKREMIGPSIEAMKERRVRIRGYMLPGFQQKGIKQFVLVRDNMECCFGPGAALFDCILVNMNSSLSAEFSIRPIAVVGVFDIEVILGPDGYPLAIYHLRTGQVE